MAIFGLFGDLPVFESEEKLPDDANQLWRMGSSYVAPENPQYDPGIAAIILRKLIEVDRSGEFMEARELLGRILLPTDPAEGKLWMYRWYRWQILHEPRLYVLGRMLSDCFAARLEDYPLLLRCAFERIQLDLRDPANDPVGLCLYWHLIRLSTHQLERRTRLLDDPVAFFAWLDKTHNSADALYHLSNLTGDREQLSFAAQGGSILAIDQMIGPDFSRTAKRHDGEVWKGMRMEHFARKKQNYPTFDRSAYANSTYYAFKNGVALNRKADAEMEQRHIPGLPPESRKISGMNWREHATAPIEVMRTRFERLKEIEAEFHHPMTAMTMGTYVVYPNYGGVPEEECVKYLTRAAEVGITLAIVYLGLHYYHAKKYDQALPWLRKAALRGFSSELQLSCALTLLSKTDKTADDMQEAVRWLRLSKDNGNKTAEAFLTQQRQHLQPNSAQEKSSP